MINQEIQDKQLAIKMAPAHELKDWLKRLGLVSEVSSGIQVDVNAALGITPQGTFTDKALCDHNCAEFTNGSPTGGHYACPAALSLNHGLKRESLAPADILLKGIDNVAKGIWLARSFFLSDEFFSSYLSSFNLPLEVGHMLKSMLESGRIEVNLFGGNPEMHRQLTTIIYELKQRGFVVNLTNTGRRFMVDKIFQDEIVEVQPDIIALSADDFTDSEEIVAIANMSLEEIRARWKKIPWQHGQRQKAFEAIYTAKLSQENIRFPKILFNMVIHPANLQRAGEMIEALVSGFPMASVNPYPVQAAFMHAKPAFGEHELMALELLCNRIVDLQLLQGEGHMVGLTPRLHYWIMLKAAYEAFRGDWAKISELVSGYGIWRCYETPGAGRFIQITTSPKERSEKRIPGGYLGCFWNSETVTNPDDQVWTQNQEEIKDHLLVNMMQLGHNAKHPCPGCAFPRLNFDMMSLELGLSRDLLPFYLKLRKTYIGF